MELCRSETYVIIPQWTLLGVGSGEDSTMAGHLRQHQPDQWESAGRDDLEGVA